MSETVEHAAEEDFRGTARFIVQRRIGEGAVGVVYLARDLEKNTEVALKTLRRADALALYRFKQEFRALADVSHPNLAGLYELMSKGDQWFFTMELVDGVDFLTYVRPERASLIPIDHHATIRDRALFTTEREREREAEVTKRAQSKFDHTTDRAPSPSGGFDVVRLESGLVQLAHGVIALHDAGKLHRDIKPTNVLVTREDRVVLLDFGLVTELEPGRASELGGRRNICGTAGYMSPEQSGAHPLGPASDWYSVGVMLFEALTGQLPFLGTVDGVLRDKQTFEPPPPRSLVPGIPAHLDRLAVRLLKRRPEDRASGRDILNALGGTTGPIFELDGESSTGQVSITSPVPARQVFVGRSMQLAQLRDAFDAARHGRATVAVVSGPSGVGKSALVKRFTDELLEKDEAIVLSGRCYERESVPYKALDNLVDALCDQLIQRRDASLLEMKTSEAAALARLFPVMTRLRPIQKAAKSEKRANDPREVRRRGFAALKKLFSRLSALKPLILAIDDLQWGDADSAALLIELLRPPGAPSLMLLLSHRPEGTPSPVLTELREHVPRGRSTSISADVREISLAALNENEARDLAFELLAGARPEQDDDRAVAISKRHAAAIARESRGSPFFVAELVRFAHAENDAESTRSKEITLEEVILARIRRLAPEARRFLELVAIAARPLEIEIATKAAELADNDKLTLPALRAAHLLRVRGGRGLDRVEALHDRIRETVHASLSKETLLHHHRRLARAMEALGADDQESLANHYQGGGEPERAARCFATAAEQAADMLAFERAARLYRQSIALEPSSERVRELFALLGDALANAGRGAESAHSYLNSARGAPPDAQLERKRRAAEQLLRSGHVDEGLTVSREVLGAVGMSLAKTPRRALGALAIQRARLAARGLSFKERAPTDLDQAELARIDICWSVALGLGMVDVIRSTEFQSRHLVLALEAGEAYRIARALSGEALMFATRGAKGRDKTEDLLNRAQQIAERIEHPHAIGFSTMARGMAANLVGHWKHGRRLLEQALEVFRDRCTGVSWETATSEHMAIWALAYLGEMAELQDRVPILLDEAKGRGDVYFATHLSTGMSSLAWLARDDVDGARRVLGEGIGHWSQQGFHLQHYNAMLAEAHIELYCGDGATALRRIDNRWSQLQSSLLLRVQQIRVEALHLRARAHLACASMSEADERARHLSIVDRTARAIEAEEVAWATPLGRLLRAGVAAAKGDSSIAARLYEDAALNFEGADMGLYAAVARHREGELSGGARGREMARESETFMESRRIRCPDRFADMLAPVVRVRNGRGN